MSCFVRRIAASGSALVQEVPDPATSLHEAAAAERPGGVYAAFGTWNDHRVIRLSDHFERLHDSARRLGFELTLDRPIVLAELCAMLREARLPGARIRISVHPDDVGVGHPAPLLVVMEPYAGPAAELREHGVSCATAPHAARANPRAKQTSWLVSRSATAGFAPYEWLLLDDENRILEGASSNFYAVIDGTLRTAGSEVLFGISRSIVLEVAPAVVRVSLDPPGLADLARMSEAFFTSASRGIVPVVSIDEQRIGAGVPGPMTRELIARYEARARELEEPLCEVNRGSEADFRLH